jgi:TATA-binding protein-associated factor Taf7
MTQQELEVYLVEAMKKLDTATDKILKTNGYTQDAKKMRLMIELIKEQIRNENSMSTARAAR